MGAFQRWYAGRPRYRRTKRLDLIGNSAVTIRDYGTIVHKRKLLLELTQRGFPTNHPPRWLALYSYLQSAYFSDGSTDFFTDGTQKRNMTKLITTKKIETHIVSGEKQITFNLFFFQICCSRVLRDKNRQENKNLSEHFAGQIASRTLKPYPPCPSGNKSASVLHYWFYQQELHLSRGS